MYSMQGWPGLASCQQPAPDRRYRAHLLSLPQVFERMVPSMDRIPKAADLETSVLESAESVLAMLTADLSMYEIPLALFYTPAAALQEQLPAALASRRALPQLLQMSQPSPTQHEGGTSRALRGRVTAGRRLALFGRADMDDDE
jgi:hypothetical protein